MAERMIKVGLEIHARILANTKLFSGASTEFVHHLPNANEQVALFDASMPGTLPRLNGKCVEHAVRTGLALNATVNKVSRFERKHYFYGDSPLGFQITQQRWPIVSNGLLEYDVAVEGETKRKKSVRITRIQLEQDTGRMLENGDTDLLDLNRAGTGVMEIVTEPDMTSAVEAGEFVRTIRQLLKAIKTCDGNMQDGSLRVDVNVSIHEENLNSHRVEIKNLNSIRYVVQAIKYEVKRLGKLYGDLEKYDKNYLASPTMEKPAETRMFDVGKGKTFELRSKETKMDYRFFPEPDLLPVLVSEEMIQEIRENFPELPAETMARLQAEPFNLSEYDAHVLMTEPNGPEFFLRAHEASLNTISDANNALVKNTICNVLMGVVHGASLDLETCGMDPEYLVEAVKLVDTDVISLPVLKRLLIYCFAEENRANLGKKTPLEIVKEQNWEQIHDEQELRMICEKIVAREQKTKKGKKNLKKYYDGNDQLLPFFYGMVQFESNHRANIKLSQEIMLQVLEKYRPKE